MPYKRLTLKIKQDNDRGSPGRPKGCKFKVGPIDREGLLDNFIELESALFEFRVALNKFVEHGNKSAAMEAKRKASRLIALAKIAKPAIQAALDDLILIKE